MTKRAFNLKIDSDLAAEMKLQAIREDRTVSEIAEFLFRKYLESQGKSARAKGKPSKQ
jgi:hypothetical protein